MKNHPPAEIWFLTGSQHLYGKGPLEQVAADSEKIVAELTATARLLLKLVFKPILDRPEGLRHDPFPWGPGGEKPSKTRSRRGLSPR